MCLDVALHVTVTVITYQFENSIKTSRILGLLSLLVICKILSIHFKSL